MADLVLGVDVEQLVTTFLRDQPEVTALVADRVYTDLPHVRAYPLVLLYRTGGAPRLVVPSWLDEAELTVECRGDAHKQVERVAATVVACLTQRLQGQRWPLGAVTKAQVLQQAYTPIEDIADPQGHAQPCYVVTLAITTHP